MKRFLLAVGLAGVLLVAGCGPREPGLSESRMVNDSFPYATLVLGSDALYRGVRLAEPKIRQRGDFKQASVTVQNLTDSDYQLEYKFEWFDEGGFKISEGSWKRFSLSGHEIRRFTSTGNTAEASQYSFTVRPVEQSD